GADADRSGDAGHPAACSDAGIAACRIHVTRSSGRPQDCAWPGCALKLDLTKPQVVAHRGSSAAHEENSWAAFEAAVTDGADVIECDVQGTRDGVLVIRHDLAIG